MENATGRMEEEDFKPQVIVINIMKKSSLEVEVDHTEKVVDSIQRDVKDIAKLGADTKALVEGMSQRVTTPNRKLTSLKTGSGISRRRNSCGWNTRPDFQVFLVTLSVT